MIVSEVKDKCPTCGVGVTKKGSHCRAHRSPTFKEKKCESCSNAYRPWVGNQRNCRECIERKKEKAKLSA